MEYYKVWVHVEYINEDEGVYEDVGLPVSIGGKLDTLDEAEALMAKITDKTVD